MVATAATPDPIPMSASPEALGRVLDAVEATTFLVWSKATDVELARLAGLPNAKLLCAAPRRWPRSGKAGRA
jgi:hypothetical protein